MLSGRRLDLLEPSALDVEIEDIAQGLSRVATLERPDQGRSCLQRCPALAACAGHLPRLETGPDIEHQLVCLLHDAPEYVVGDMISPFKAVVGGDYKSVEERLQEAIHLRFSLPVRTA